VPAVHRARSAGPSENVKPVDSGLRVRCPQCGRQIDLGQAPGLSDIRCDSCGTTFSIVDDKAVSETTATLDRIGQFEILAKLGTVPSARSGRPAIPG
jgi:DNA-directed RNA polymerase subunit RPC12/RpoP